tara:strand:- start:5034 stop:5432 length:399 start_codon:yes stop_codon:yes gene_type:complete
MKSLRVNTAVFNQILEHLRNTKKIAAIKALRSSGGFGLKDAKEAVERLMHEKNLGHYPNAAENGHRIVVGPLIKKLILDFGEGDIEVDLETMQMMTLMKLQKIGLDSCGDILDLVETLQAFAAGKKIGVIDV